MAAKLDRSRAFATIVGIVDDELSGACFYQDGKHFTASGEELNPAPEPKELESEVPAPEPVVHVVKAQETPTTSPEKKKPKSKEPSDLDLL